MRGGDVPAGVQATESGQAALLEVMIKPMPTPQLAEDWGL